MKGKSVTFLGYVIQWVILVVLSNPTEGNSDEVSLNIEDCPCVAASICPRKYGISALDIDKIGVLTPCEDDSMVRCCGVSVSVVHSSEEETHVGTSNAGDSLEDPLMAQDSTISERIAQFRRRLRKNEDKNEKKDEENNDMKNDKENVEKDTAFNIHHRDSSRKNRFSWRRKKLSHLEHIPDLVTDNGDDELPDSSKQTPQETFHQFSRFHRRKKIPSIWQTSTHRRRNEDKVEDTTSYDTGIKKDTTFSRTPRLKQKTEHDITNHPYKRRYGFSDKRASNSRHNSGQREEESLSSDKNSYEQVNHGKTEMISVDHSDEKVKQRSEAIKKTLMLYYNNNNTRRHSSLIPTLKLVKEENIGGNVQEDTNLPPSLDDSEPIDKLAGDLVSDENGMNEMNRAEDEINNNDGMRIGSDHIENDSDLGNHDQLNSGNKYEEAQGFRKNNGQRGIRRFVVRRRNPVLMTSTYSKIRSNTDEHEASDSSISSHESRLVPVRTHAPPRLKEVEDSEPLMAENHGGRFEVDDLFNLGTRDTSLKPQETKKHELNEKEAKEERKHLEHDTSSITSHHNKKKIETASHKRERLYDTTLDSASRLSSNNYKKAEDEKYNEENISRPDKPKTSIVYSNPEQLERRKAHGKPKRRRKILKRVRVRRPDHFTNFADKRIEPLVDSSNIKVKFLEDESDDNRMKFQIRTPDGKRRQLLVVKRKGANSDELTESDFHVEEDTEATEKNETKEEVIDGEEKFVFPPFKPSKDLEKESLLSSSAFSAGEESSRFPLKFPRKDIIEDSVPKVRIPGVKDQGSLNRIRNKGAQMKSTGNALDALRLSNSHSSLHESDTKDKIETTSRPKVIMRIRANNKFPQFIHSKKSTPKENSAVDRVRKPAPSFENSILTRTPSPPVETQNHFPQTDSQKSSQPILLPTETPVISQNPRVRKPSQSHGSSIPTQNRRPLNFENRVQSLKEVHNLHQHRRQKPKLQVVKTEVNKDLGNRFSVEALSTFNPEKQKSPTEIKSNSPRHRWRPSQSGRVRFPEDEKVQFVLPVHHIREKEKGIGGSKDDSTVANKFEIAHNPESLKLPDTFIRVEEPHHLHSINKANPLRNKQSQQSHMESFEFDGTTVRSTGSSSLVDTKPRLEYSPVKRIREDVRRIPVSTISKTSSALPGAIRRDPPRHVSSHMIHPTAHAIMESVEDRDESLSLRKSQGMLPIRSIFRGGHRVEGKENTGEFLSQNFKNTPQVAREQDGRLPYKTADPVSMIKPTHIEFGVGYDDGATKKINDNMRVGDKDPMKDLSVYHVAPHKNSAYSQTNFHPPSPSFASPLDSESSEIYNVDAPPPHISPQPHSTAQRYDESLNTGAHRRPTQEVTGPFPTPPSFEGSHRPIHVTPYSAPPPRQLPLNIPNNNHIRGPGAQYPSFQNPAGNRNPLRPIRPSDKHSSLKQGGNSSPLNSQSYMGSYATSNNQITSKDRRPSGNRFSIHSFSNRTHPQNYPISLQRQRRPLPAAKPSLPQPQISNSVALYNKMRPTQQPYREPLKQNRKTIPYHRFSTKSPLFIRAFKKPSAVGNSGGYKYRNPGTHMIRRHWIQPYSSVYRRNGGYRQGRELEGSTEMEDVDEITLSSEEDEQGGLIGKEKAEANGSARYILNGLHGAMSSSDIKKILRHDKKSGINQFSPPKAQGGFMPVVVYSEEDPGPVVVKLESE